jgi:hypothetical protein
LRKECILTITAEIILVVMYPKGKFKIWLMFPSCRSFVLFLREKAGLKICMLYITIEMRSFYSTCKRIKSVILVEDENVFYISRR